MITNLLENTFYAEIHIQVGGVPITVDSRPSDAIALALRAAAPVFVEEEVLVRNAANDDPSEAQSSERLKKWLEQVDPDSLGKYRM